MPKLKMFLACRQILTEPDTSSTELSAIGILGTVRPAIPEGVSIPVDAILPFSWAMLLVWLLEPHELEKNYQTRIQSISPSGREPLAELIHPFTANEPSQVIISKIDGFPVGEEGLYRLVASLREEGQEAWSIGGEYEITVTYNRGA